MRIGPVGRWTPLIAAVWLVSLTSQAAVTLGVTRQVPGNAYPAGGGMIDVTLRIEAEGAGTLLSLSIEERLPEGWAFESLVSSVPGTLLIQPAPGDRDALGFSWQTPPAAPEDFPLTLTYRVAVPAGDLLPKTITGRMTYNDGTPGDHLVGPLISTLQSRPVVIGMTRGVSGPYSPAGGHVDATLHFTAAGDGTLLSLSVAETIPEGWTFDSIVGGFPGTMLARPARGATGQLSFAWLRPPELPDDFPFALTYRMRVPPGQGGIRRISGEASYNGGSRNDVNTGPVVSELMPSSLLLLMERQVPAGVYSAAGGDLDVSLHIERSGQGPLLSLSIEEALPAGWAFTSILSAIPGTLAVSPSPGDSTMTLVWQTPPDASADFPLDITYRVSVPAGQSGRKEIAGTGAYNGGLPEDQVLGPCITEIGQQALELGMTRSVPGSVYPTAGGTVDVTVTFNALRSGALLSMNLEETIPSGWSYNGLLAPVPGSLLIEPTPGDEGSLGFVWLDMPSYPGDFPVTVQYRLNVPAGGVGEKHIAGHASYNGGTPDTSMLGPTETVLAQSALELTVSRTAGAEGLYPVMGGSMDVHLTFSANGAGRLFSLAFAETLPPGWTFDTLLASVPGTLLVQPAQGEPGTLYFAWIDPPDPAVDFPFTLSYRVVLPPGETRDREIVGQGFYNPATPNDRVLGPLGTTLTSSSASVQAYRVVNGNNKYASAGGVVSVRYTLNALGDGPLLSLSLREVLPSGWQFYRLSDPPPGTLLRQPQQGNSGLLSFLWLQAPAYPADFPASFTYEVTIPPGETGSRTFSGDISYNGGSSDDRTYGPIQTNVTSIDSLLYLDFVTGSDANTGMTASDALGTLAEAIDRVSVGGTIRIQAGDGAAPPRITKAVVLTAAGGGVRLGVPQAAQYAEAAPLADKRPLLDALLRLLVAFLQALQDELTAKEGQLSLDVATPRTGTVWEPVLPPAFLAGESCAPAARPDSLLAVRLRAPHALRPGTLWGEAVTEHQSALATAWLPATPGDASDVWLLFHPDLPWRADHDLALRAGGHTVEGRCIESLTFHLTIPGSDLAVEGLGLCPPESGYVLPGEDDPSADDAGLRLLECESAPVSVAGGVGSPMLVWPFEVYEHPRTVWLRVPDGESPDALNVYYFHRHGADTGWYPAENVLGWYVPGSLQARSGSDGTWLTFQVWHGGIVQAGP